MARARDEMQAACLIRAFLANAAGLTKIARVQQPDPGKRDILAGRDAAHDGAQHFREDASLRHRDHDLWKIDAFHCALLRVLVK